MENTAPSQILIPVKIAVRAAKGAIQLLTYSNHKTSAEDIHLWHFQHWGFRWHQQLLYVAHTEFNLHKSTCSISGMIFIFIVIQFFIPHFINNPQTDFWYSMRMKYIHMKLQLHFLMQETPQTEHLNIQGLVSLLNCHNRSMHYRIKW